MKDLERDYFLKDMPFNVVPDSSKDIIWAGMKDIKNKFEIEIQKSLIVSNTKILINYGSYGSGKTHSATYFSSNKHFGFAKDKNIKSFLLKFPKNAKNPTEDIFQSFLGKYGIKNLIDDLKTIKKNSNFGELLNSYSDDEEIINIIIKILEFDSIDDVKMILYNKATNTLLNKKGIFKRVENDNVIKVFAVIIKLLTNQKYNLLILWLDEFEDITTLNSTNANKITSFIRDLIDNIPQKLLIYLNFVPTAFVDLDSLYNYFIGSSLERRVKSGVEFKNLSKDNIKEYVKELLEICRVENFKNSNVFFPFTEELIDEIYKNLSSELTVGKLNKILSELLENAIVEDISEITKEYFETKKVDLYSLT